VHAGDIKGAVHAGDIKGAPFDPGTQGFHALHVAVHQVLRKMHYGVGYLGEALAASTWREGCC
jgi:hypothetical protein